MKMKINSKDFRVRPGEKVKLKEWPTLVKPFCKSRKRYKKRLKEHVEALSSFDGKTIWEGRYRSIMDLEEHLHRNGTRIIKIFLHQSKDEQGKRFRERIDEPDKNWKFSLSDIHQRNYRKHYMKAYETYLNATSTPHAPWYVVPADDKEFAQLIVSQLVLDALNELKLAYPKTTAKRWRELKSIRKRL